MKIDVWVFYNIFVWVYKLVCLALLSPQGKITPPDKHKESSNNSRPPALFRLRIRELSTIFIILIFIFNGNSSSSVVVEVKVVVVVGGVEEKI